MGRSAPGGGCFQAVLVSLLLQPAICSRLGRRGGELVEGVCSPACGRGGLCLASPGEWRCFCHNPWVGPTCDELSQDGGELSRAGAQHSEPRSLSPPAAVPAARPSPSLVAASSAGGWQGLRGGAGSRPPGAAAIQPSLLPLAVFGALCPAVPCSLGLTLDDLRVVHGDGHLVGIAVAPPAPQRDSVRRELQRQLFSPSSQLRSLGAEQLGGGADTVVWFAHGKPGAAGAAGALTAEARARSRPSSPVWTAAVVLDQQWSHEEPAQQPSATDAIVGDVYDIVNSTTTVAVGQQAQNQEGDLEEFFLSMGINTVLVCGVAVGFSFLRVHFPMVYGTRLIPDRKADQKEAPKLDDSYFAWIQPCVWGIRSREVIAYAGLDHAMYLEFTSLSMRIMIAIGIPFLLFLVPLNLCCGGGKSQASGDFLSMQGLNNVVDYNWLWWLQSLVCYYVVFVTFTLLRTSLEGFIPKRMEWLRTMSHVRATTLLVESIPSGEADEADSMAEMKVAELEAKLYRRGTHLDVIKQKTGRKLNDPERLARYLNSNIFEGRLATRPENIHFVKKQSTVSPLQEILEKIQQKHHKIDELKKKETSDKLPQKEREYIHHEIDRLNDKVHGLEVEAANKRADLNRDPQYNATSAFVRFEKRRDAVICQKLFSEDDMEEIVVDIPPVVEDVIWEDLSTSETVQGAKARVGIMMIIGVFLAFAPAVVWMKNYTKWSSLDSMMPFLGLSDPAWHRTQQTWDGLVETTVLTVLMGIVPSIFIQIFSRFFVLKDKSKMQLELQILFYFFLVIFVMFLSAIGDSLLDRIIKIVLRPAEFFFLLAEVLPDRTHFFLNYFHAQWFACALQMIRLAQLAKYTALSKVYSDKVAKEMSEPEDPGTYGIGSRSALTVMNLTLAITLCAVTPIITVMGFVYFAINNIASTYLFSYAESLKGDRGGAFFIKQVEQTMFALFLYIALMTGLIYIKTQNRIPAFIAMGNFYLLYEYWKQYKADYRWEFLEFSELHALSDDGNAAKEAEHFEMYREPELRLQRSNIGTKELGHIAPPVIKEGTRLLAQQEVILWKDVNSWEVHSSKRKLHADEEVIAAGEPVETEGFWMLPVKGGGAVEMDYMHVSATPRAGSTPPSRPSPH